MEQAKMCKHNMKLYPTYYSLSYDYLFFYTINVLFLIQIKHVSIATIVLVDSFYALFSFIFQIPANIIIDKLGRKKSAILGNVLNSVYLLIYIFGQNVLHLIIAEMITAFGFALKDVVSPSILNNSIPQTTKKSKIFSKINSKGLARYYILNSISLIISGYLYNVNGYMPLILSLAVVLISLLLSICFIEPVQNNDEKEETTFKQQLSDTKDGFKYIFKSGRLKSLILYGAIMAGVISLLANLQTSMTEDLNISSTIIGLIFAFFEIVSGLSAKMQEKFHNTFKNKSLTILGISIGLFCITSTIGMFFNLPLIVTLIILTISFTVTNIVRGLYFVLINRYLSNFTNEQIDSKIFTAYLLACGIIKAILGVITSFVLELITPYETMLIVGISSLILFALIAIYMKSRLGLKVQEYKVDEIKYANLESII